MYQQSTIKLDVLCLAARIVENKIHQEVKKKSLETKMYIVTVC